MGYKDERYVIEIETVDYKRNEEGGIDKLVSIYQVPITVIVIEELGSMEIKTQVGTSVVRKVVANESTHDGKISIRWGVL